MKNFRNLSSLGSFASTLDDVEKMRLEKLTLQFLNQHDYFLANLAAFGFQPKKESFRYYS